MDELNNTGIPQKRKRNLFLNLFVTALGVFFVTVVAYMFFINPCNIPVEYTMGNIDPRFKISNIDVRAIVDDAAGRWNMSTSQTIYKYNPNAKLKINLVYDDRQAKLDETKAKIAEFDAASTSIDEFRSKVEALSSAYEKDLAGYNSRVSYWNSVGGAPQGTFNQLNNERAALEKRRVEINKMASLLNTQISANNGNIADFNNQLESDKSKIITTGEYFSDGSKINIYTYGDKNELRLVLMHELGHAMSKDHDADPKSILYPVLQAQDMTNPQPSSEDMTMVAGKCQLNSTISKNWPVIQPLAKYLRSLISGGQLQMN